MDGRLYIAFEGTRIQICSQTNICIWSGNTLGHTILRSTNNIEMIHIMDSSNLNNNNNYD